MPLSGGREHTGALLPVTDADVVVWYNPALFEVPGRAEELLAVDGVSARRVLYLDDPPP